MKTESATIHYCPTSPLNNHLGYRPAADERESTQSPRDCVILTPPYTHNCGRYIDKRGVALGAAESDK